MNIPGLGPVVEDQRFGWYYSAALPLALLNGQPCQVVLDGYAKDRFPEQFHAAIANLLACSFSVLRAAEPYVFQYYEDVNVNWNPSDKEFVRIGSPSEVWQHVRFGTKAMVRRRGRGDRGVYVSLECGCDWEPEHGLQIVLKNGSIVTKVGPYDGHLTNAEAYADESLENVVYR
jgi:hypothetical protein